MCRTAEGSPLLTLRCARTQQKLRVWFQAAQGSSFEGALQAVQSSAEQQVAALAGAIKAAIQDEQAARQKRHTFTLEAVSDMGEQPPPLPPITIMTRRNE